MSSAWDINRKYLSSASNAHIYLSKITLFYSALATVKIVLDILPEEEALRIDSITGHGGQFKKRMKKQQEI